MTKPIVTTFLLYTLFLAILPINMNVLAHEPSKGTVNAYAGPVFFFPDTDKEYAGYDNSASNGFSLFALADMDNNGGIEAGLMYLNQFFYRNEQNLAVVEKSKRFYVFMGYRHWFIPQVSTGLSVFSTYSMGKEQSIHQSSAAASEFGTSAQESSSQGISVSFQYDQAVNPIWSAVIDLRYLYHFNQRSDEVDAYGGLVISIKRLIQTGEMSPSAVNNKL